MIHRQPIIKKIHTTSEIPKESSTKDTSLPKNLKSTNTLKTSPESSPSPPYRVDLLTLLQANIDDATPEVLAYAIDIILDMGAVDAWIQPIVMKKGRSAHMLSCLLSTTDEDKISSFIQLIFRHTTTIGIRLQRKWDVQLYIDE